MPELKLYYYERGETLRNRDAYFPMLGVLQKEQLQQKPKVERGWEKDKGLLDCLKDL